MDYRPQEKTWFYMPEKSTSATNMTSASSTALSAVEDSPLRSWRATVRMTTRGRGRTARRTTATRSSKQHHIDRECRFHYVPCRSTLPFGQKHDDRWDPGYSHSDEGLELVAGRSRRVHRREPVLESAAMVLLVADRGAATTGPITSTRRPNKCRNRLQAPDLLRQSHATMAR